MFKIMEEKEGKMDALQKEGCDMEFDTAEQAKSYIYGILNDFCYDNPCPDDGFLWCMVIDETTDAEGWVITATRCKGKWKWKYRIYDVEKAGYYFGELGYKILTAEPDHFKTFVDADYEGDFFYADKESARKHIMSILREQIAHTMETVMDPKANPEDYFADNGEVLWDQIPRVEQQTESSLSCNKDRYELRITETYPRKKEECYLYEIVQGYEHEINWIYT